MALPAEASTSASTSAPLKLTFRLSSASATPAQSATPSPPASEPMELSHSVQSDAGSTAPVGKDKDGKDKPKRKRAPKRPPGEPGPGKSWRKGMKGNIVGVGLPGGSVLGLNPPSPSSSSSLPPPRQTASHPIGQIPKVATSFLPPMALDISSPPVRKWKKEMKEFKSITGGKLVLGSWVGSPNSPYHTSRAPPSPSPPPQTPNSPAAAAALAHSFVPRSHSPLAAPATSTSTSDPKVAAATAAAHFRNKKLGSVPVAGKKEDSEEMM